MWSSIKISDFPGSPVANVNASSCAKLCSEAKLKHPSLERRKVYCESLLGGGLCPENPGAS